MFDMSNIVRDPGHSTPARRLAVLFALAPFPAAPALGQDLAADRRPDKSRYTLLNPTPRELMRAMATDRPDSTESAYSVDAGHFQIESSFFDFTRDRRNDDDVTQRSLAVAPTILKLGLTNRVDAQLGFAPLTFTDQTDRAAGEKSEDRGFSDLMIRVKTNLWGNDAGPSAAAVMPFVTLPTGDDGISADHVEGGLIFPFALTLPAEFSMGAMAEFDIVRNADNNGYAIDCFHTATVGHDLVGDLAGFVEYAGRADLSGELDYRASFNTGLTYALTPDLQFDGGIRLGLTRAADDFGFFLGLSWRH